MIVPKMIKSWRGLAAYELKVNNDYSQLMMKKSASGFIEIST